MADNVEVASGTGVPTATQENLDSKHVQVMLPYANPTHFLNGRATATTTSDTSLIAAQGASVLIYVTLIIVYNSSNTDTLVDIKDGTTTKLTVPAPGKGGVVVPLTVPLKLTANAALQFASGAAVTTMYVSAVGYKDNA